MKKSTTSLLAFLLLFTLITSSCRKDKVPESEEVYLNTNTETATGLTRQEISTWIDEHKTGLNSDKITNIELLEQNLEFGKAKTEKRNNGDNLIIIPIRDTFLERKNLNKNFLLNLLLVQNEAGKLKWATIICFLPANEKKIIGLSSSSIRNVLNNQPVEDAGMYKFLNLNGHLLYQQEYRDKKIVSWGRFAAKNNNQDKNNNNTKIVNSTCTDWYLVTTIYYADGTTSVTEEYVGSSCDGCDNSMYMSLCPSDGGSGPEMPIDQELGKEAIIHNSETDYTNDDMEITPSADIGGGVPGYRPLDYTYRVYITYGSQSGLIHNAILNDLIVLPNNETYVHPSGETVQRVATPITHLKTGDILGYSVNCTWLCEVNFRYTYQPSGRTITRQRSANAFKNISVP